MGVLSGYRVIEMAGMGPCPMAGMLMADMGAEVICIDRNNNDDLLGGKDMSRRGKKSIIVNLKSDGGREALLKIIASADILIEGFRPGVMEKLGVGPEDCHAVNPALIYGRMTGWGQTGPLADKAGHDINYISLAGALHAVGRKGEKPVVPLNFIGDFGGGALFLAMGVLGALLEAKNSGQGQVVDAAMVDGAANLMWTFYSLNAVGRWNFEERESNLLDGGAFFYDTYETADGKYVAVGAIEPQFFEQLVTLGGLDTRVFNPESQADVSRWPELKVELAKVFRQKTRDEWCQLLDNSDACFSPVLSAMEVPHHPHNQQRNSYITVDDYLQPSPAPRFSRTPSSVDHGCHVSGADTQDVLVEAGFSNEQIKRFKADGAVI